MMLSPSQRTTSGFLQRLSEPQPLIGVELRPPRSGLSYADSVDTWIDLNHSIRKLVRGDTVVFLTDNAVGRSEEENLQHLTTNLAEHVDASKIVPFLTCKHSLEYCLMYATRAASHGIEALTVLGGDLSSGLPRCLPHAHDLRWAIRKRMPSLQLGGWANPHRDPVKQVDFLLRENFAAEFFLTQIVSHHSIDAVGRFLAEVERRDVPYPGVFGIFMYRSPNPKTLAQLSRFFPVPAPEITRDFESGLSPEEICARSIRALRDVGVNRVYVSNLGFRKVEERYRRVLAAMGES